MGFAHSSKHGQLTINSVALMNKAWRVQNLAEMWSRTTRGASLPIPGAAGRKSRNRKGDEIVHPMMLRVLGVNPTTGAEVADPFAQLAANMVALEAVAVNPTGNAGHAISWALANGTTRAGSCWVQNWVVADDENTAINIVNFDLVIPAGGLT